MEIVLISKQGRCKISRFNCRFVYGIGEVAVGSIISNDLACNKGGLKVQAAIRVIECMESEEPIDAVVIRGMAKKDCVFQGRASLPALDADIAERSDLRFTYQ